MPSQIELASQSSRNGISSRRGLCSRRECRGEELVRRRTVEHYFSRIFAKLPFCIEVNEQNSFLKIEETISIRYKCVDLILTLFVCT